MRKESNWLEIFWYLLDPIILFLTFIYLFTTVFNIEDPVYPVYLLIGLIVFNFFRNSTVKSFHYFRNIKKEDVNFRHIFHNFMGSVFVHLFEIALIILVLNYYGVSLGGLLFYPLIFLIFSLFILGVSMILSVVGHYVTVFIKGWGILTRTLWFVTPTFYFVENTSHVFFVNLFNPLFYFVYISREFILYNKIPEMWMVFIILSMSLFVFLIGLLVYLRYREKIINRSK